MDHPKPETRVGELPLGSRSLLARYIRVKILPQDHPQARPNFWNELGKPNYRPIAIPNAVGITSKSVSDRTHAPIGKCIYCGVTTYLPNSDEPLHEEHILAAGMGGTLILPEASCLSCEDAIKRSEGKVLRTSLFAPRGRLKVRRKKKKHLDAYPVVTEVDGKDVEIIVPLQQHPTLLFMVGLHPPKIFMPRAESESDVALLFAYALGPEAEQPKKAFASPGFDLVRFSQMLAKIAHGYAVYLFGLGGWTQFLPPLIRRNYEKTQFDRTIFEWVGGVHGTIAASDDLHTLGHEIAIRDGRRYLVVYIRLFANLGAPIYSVVAGEMPQ